MINIQKIEAVVAQTTILEKVKKEEELVWINPHYLQKAGLPDEPELSMVDIDDAEARLLRFAPLILKIFPETVNQNGLIESELRPIPAMKKRINEKYRAELNGALLLKMDSHLAIAGSVKARGGIYEVLKYTEDLAIANGILSANECYDGLLSEKKRQFFSQYTIQVGSTGNLGMSIGIIAAALGYETIVHMSADAKQWKKDLLRGRGVKVLEYDSDYCKAVEAGRQLSDQNPKSYFVDDENSRNLFLGYAVAAKRLRTQFIEQGIAVDTKNPLFVYIPCGVGGAPGGVGFGLKQVFGNHVHLFFVEPTQAPCMLVGMSTGLHNGISVVDIGLTGLTHADGLAVNRPSGFVGDIMEPLLGGIFTVADKNLFHYLRDMLETEAIFLEPSACAAFTGVIHMSDYEASRAYLRIHGLVDKMADATHIVWATGGSLVPETMRNEYEKTFL
jgi:D-serine ammonia-lyase (EC 4.3.1.18)